MSNFAFLLDQGRCSIDGSALSCVPNESRVAPAEVEVQRVSVGSGVGYAIIANGHWLGSLTGADARAFRDEFGPLKKDDAERYLVGVARKMAAALHYDTAAKTSCSAA